MLKSKPLCWFVRQFGMRTHGNEAPAWQVLPPPDQHQHSLVPDQHHQQVQVQVQVQVQALVLVPVLVPVQVPEATRTSNILHACVSRLTFSRVRRPRNRSRGRPARRWR